MSMISEAVNIAYKYITSICNAEQFEIVESNLMEIAGIDIFPVSEFQLEFCASYEEIQDLLSKLNEKESIRKEKGVYYTPPDVVDFIVCSSIKLVFGELGRDSIKSLEFEGSDFNTFCKKKKAFDPTCGAGEFLVAILSKKFELWNKNNNIIKKSDVKEIVSTIYGNDINSDSTVISKLRLYLCAVNHYGIENCVDLPRILNDNFSIRDYVVNPPKDSIRFDIVVGNPPYVEDVNSGLELKKSYGNIYANVLVNAANQLKDGGVFGFIVPLSYVSTPRMQKLRTELYEIVPEQYILSYSDRPDCLFTSVHQKLCILICRKISEGKTIFTSNYQYWYKEERKELFSSTSIVKNNFVKENYIPKLGNTFDVSIYNKVVAEGKETSIKSLCKGTNDGVFVNMRASFWIKAFRNSHEGSEYKFFGFDNSELSDYMMCILNSSLFWWYWVCISDCWHITSKELVSFRVPEITDYEKVSKLAESLECKLEKTKIYVGTKQTEYEYKHKLCVDIINEIDDYINAVYGLTRVESDYIKEFAYQYRISGGAINESN